ncbi:RNA polymerase sigma-70 factor [Flavobacteriaceae bacterium LMO-SS05]
MITKAEINNDLFITLIKEKSAVGFQLLFTLYRAKLLHFAYGYVSNKEDAEEIVQDVFIKLWKQEDIHTNFNGYIYKVTRNACLDYLRKKKLTLNIENNTVQIEAAINYAALADEQSSLLIENELEQAILKAIDQLPEKCKNVFILSKIEGFKHKDISKALNIRPKTVENHMTRALKFMRVSLKDFLTFL